MGHLGGKFVQAVTRTDQVPERMRSGTYQLS